MPTSKNAIRGAFPAAVLLSVAGLALTGCSAASSAAPASSHGRVTVVASTDVYGDIASQIGGRAVTVTSILTNPNQDPHTFEADAQTQLAISKAQVIIENGGGYDDFVDTMRNSTNSTAALINAVKISGKRPVDGDLNEHVFYDYPTMVRVADAMAADFSRKAPSEKATFDANARAFAQKMQRLEAQTAAIKAKCSGDEVSYTEPVPGYLFDAMGLRNVTPEAFSHAVEEGNDVPPAALNDELTLIRNKTVKMLAFNEQASSPEASQAQAAAKKAGVPVVAVTETLPRGDSYEIWQQGNIDTMKAALAK